MVITGRTIYFDGRSPQGPEVAFSLDTVGLTLTEFSGRPLAFWPMASLKRLESPKGRFRLACRDQPDARLEVSDPRSVEELTIALRDLNDGSRTSWKQMAGVGGLALAAAGSVALLVLFGIPKVAMQLAPLVPAGLETSIGDQVKPQIVDMLTHGKRTKTCVDPDGKTALDKVTAPLVAAASAPFSVSIEVLDVPLANAFALPGGSIVVFRGLLDRVSSAEELSGVLAHELGHVVHRDAMRNLIESAGLSVVLGIVIGDYSGSTLAVIVGRSLVDASFSREVEADADAFAVQLLTRLGRDPRALGDALLHITDKATPGTEALQWLSTHPATQARVAALRGADPVAVPKPLLSPEEWTSLKAICR